MVKSFIVEGRPDQSTDSRANRTGLIDNAKQTIEGISGDLSTYIMLPDDGALAAGDGEDEILNNSTGFKAIKFSTLETIATNTAVIIVLSTTADDNAAVAAAANSLDGELDTGTGAANANCIVLTNQRPTATVVYDGTNTIKTIGVRHHNGAAGELIVETVG